VQLDNIESARLAADVGMSCSQFAVQDDEDFTDSTLESENIPVVGAQVSCATWLDGNAVLGMASGAIVCLDGVDAKSAILGHQGGVAALQNLLVGGAELIVSAGGDGALRVWSTTLELLSEVLLSPISAMQPIGISALDVCDTPTGGCVVIGTSAGGIEIVDIEVLSEGADAGRDAGSSPPSKAGIEAADEDVKLVIRTTGPTSALSGHSGECLRSLAVHPSKLIAATGGDDGFVALWDIRFPRVLGVVDAACGVSALAFHPGGEHLAIGLGGSPVGTGMHREGTLVVVSMATLEPVFEGRETASSCSCIAYSPDGNTLAFATVEGAVFLFDISAKYDLRGSYSGIRGGASAMDFSCDGRVIRAFASDGAMHYIESRSAEDASHLKGVASCLWQKHTCPCGWELEGLDGFIENGVQVSCGDRQPIHPQLRSTTSGADDAAF